MTTSSWIFWAFLSALFAAMTTIFAKVGIQGVDSDFATLIRTVIVLLLLTIFVNFTGKWANLFHLSKYNWFFLCLSGFATGASWVCFYRALQIGEASKVLVVDKFSIVIVAVLAFIFLGEKPILKDCFGIFLVAGGLMVIAFKR
jgi:bacterial/archaeal transporter family protein